MKRSTTSLTFPDVNVWLAVLLADHSQRKIAQGWWEQDQSDVLAFVRFTQIGVLRLLTTAAAMGGAPLTMKEAWAAYDRLYSDERVAFVGESSGLESLIRQHTRQKQSSPRAWADALLIAFAQQAQANIVTFDRALARLYPQTILLG